MSEGARLRLRVTVRGARSLLAADSNGLSDPYVVGHLLSFTQQPIDGETFRTKTIKATLDPSWDESFVLGSHYHIYSDDPSVFPALRLRVFDKNRFSRDSPLGEVVIPLNALDTSGETPLERSYELQNGTLSMAPSQQAQGEIDVAISFEPDAPDEEQPGVVDDSAFEGYLEEDPSYLEKPPNCLRVVLLRGRGLLAMDAPGTLFRSHVASSDPYVKFMVGGKERARSTIKRKTLNPDWGETFEFVVDDEEFAFEAIVEDQDDVSLNDFIGKVTMPLHELSDKNRVQQAFRLRNEADVFDKDRGTVEMMVRWIFTSDANAELLDKRSKMSHRIGATLGLVKDVDSEGEDEDEEGAELEHSDDEEEEEEQLSEEEIKKQEEEAAAAAAEVMGYEITSGDYQIQVHLIEGRDLKGEDLEGTSDPVVYVEAFGQKFCTAVQYKTLNPVFDERLIFELRNVDKDDFKDSVIKISVMDADIIAANDMIGSYVVDATYVYGRKNHELYRQWVGLLDDTNPADVGVQGYLKFSIAIIGPGDKLVPHDEMEDIRKEQEAEAAGGFASMVMMPPSVSVSTRYIVATMWRAEYLPISDAGVVGDGGIDAFVAAKFGGMERPVKTKVKTLKGKRASLNPMFRTELWLPLNEPSFQSKVQFEVMDYDRTNSNDHVAIFYLDWKKFQQKLKKQEDVHKGGVGPFWVNLYGGPPIQFVDKSGDVFGGARMQYLRRSERAPHYNGRLLMSFDIRDELPNDKEGEPYEDFDRFMYEKKGRRKVKKTTRIPKSKTYHLRVVVISGQGLPWFAVRNGMQIAVSCGSYRRETAVRSVTRQNKDLGGLVAGSGGNKSGMANWSEILDLPEMELPVDDDQKPDVIIHLLRDGLPGGERLPICFCRLKAADLLRRGFLSEPQWLILQEDKVINDIPDPDQFPGTISMQFGFGTTRIAEEQLHPKLSNNPYWKDPLSKVTLHRPHQVRVFIFMGRNLPASDGDGGVDPYLKVTYGHKTQKTRICRKTTDPMWFETLTFDADLPDLAYAPQVQVQLWDYDLDLDDFLGQCYLDLRRAHIVPTLEDLEAQTGADVLNLMDDSYWMDFFEESPGDGQGQLLALVQLTRKTSPEQKLPEPGPEFIKPPLRKAWLEVLTVGLRDMIPYQFMPIQLPSVRFEVDPVSGKRADKIVSHSDTSRKPEPDNPNFLELSRFEVMLPENAFFAPAIKIFAHDTRFGGFMKPIVGQGAVKLQDKIPWSDTYVEPQQQEVYKTVAEASGAVDADKLADAGGHDAAEGAEEEKGESGVAAAAGPSDAKSGADAPTSAPAGEGELGPEDAKMDAFEAVVNPLSAEAAANAKAMKMPEDYDDTGAGVFGAVVHLDKKLTLLRKKHKSAVDRERKLEGGIPFGDFGDDDPFEEEGPPKYMIDRETLQGGISTWEELAKTTPFESYNLYTGSGEKRKVAAIFKGLIRVLQFEDDPPMFEENVLQAILKPEQYKVRLYVLRATNLPALDQAFMGRPGKSDPFLRVKLGKNLFDDRENYFEDVDEAEFYKMVEFTCELPGTSRLDVQVYDRDELFSDDLIGRTVIDLEDRWFDERWQKYGEHTLCDDPEEGVRWKVKPLENRALHSPTTTAPQGNLECWVDIMGTGEAQAYPPDDISLPANQEFEVRVVFWKTAKVPAQDLLGGQNMTDMYARIWVEGCEPLETDTHWRAKKGKGSFNWRMKFPVMLGNRTKAMKFPYLHVQLWDRDVLKWNDVIGETMLNLGPFYRQAFKKKNLVIKVFDDVRREREAKKKTVLSRFSRGVGLGKEEEKVHHNVLGGVDDDEEAEIYGDAKDEEIRLKLDSADGDSEEAKLDMDKDLMDGGEPKPGEKVDGSPPNEALKRMRSGDFGTDLESSKGKKKPEEKKKVSEEEVALLADDDDDDEDEDEDDGEDPDEAEEKQAFQGLLNSARSVLGWDLDPPDSQRLDLETTERDKDGVSTRKFMGHVWISVEIWPKSYAEGYPVGTGRSDPNQNPYLPPPVGRLQFSLNPFYMMYQICGPSLMCKIICCFLCLAFLALLIFAQPVLNILIQLFVRPI
mmetsp:Transcript_19079/g.72115  ORF Transcript_19079/g.72115 Transcript_19079/m.72115 type:complete len:2052 (-) Transcript_19079:79-6234(-)